MPTNNESPKYRAARIAAAEFSSDAQFTAKRYAELTEQKFDDWHNALKEIKGLLRDCPYRWPTFDSCAEIMIFFDPALKNLTCNAIGVVSSPDKTLITEKEYTEKECTEKRKLLIKEF